MIASDAHPAADPTTQLKTLQKNLPSNSGITAMATKKGGTLSGFNIIPYQNEVATPPPSPKPPEAPSAAPPAQPPAPAEKRAAAQAPAPPPSANAMPPAPVATPRPAVDDRPRTARDFVHVPMFKGMTEPQIALLIQQAETRTLEKGQTAFHEGARENTIFLLQMGRCEVVHAGQSMASLGAGTVLGEMALVSDMPRSASVVAERLCTFKVWDPDTLHVVFDLDPEIGVLFYRNLATVLAQRLKRANVDKRNRS